MKNINRDLSLSNIGPYSKHYAGISKVFNDSYKNMLDMFFLIGKIRGKTIVPDVNIESDYNLIAANENLTFVKYRYQLQWKNIEYADVSFFHDEEDIMVKITFVNNSDLHKNYACSLFSTLRAISYTELNLIGNEKWLDAKDYLEIDYKNGDIDWFAGDDYEFLCDTAKLAFGKDGLRKGISHNEMLVNGLGIGNVKKSKIAKTRNNLTFLFNKGTRIKYKLKDGFSLKYLHMRYISEGVENLKLKIFCGNENILIDINNIEENNPQIISAENSIVSNASCLEIVVENIVFKENYNTKNATFTIDGFLFSDSVDISERFRFFDEDSYFKWEHDEKGLNLFNNSLKDNICMYSTSERKRPPKPYSDATITHVYHHDLTDGRVLRKISNDSLYNWYTQNCIIEGDRDRHFIGYNMDPVKVRPKTSKSIFIGVSISEKASNETAKRCYDRAVKFDWTALDKKIEFEDKKGYDFSQNILKSQIFSNVTYPIVVGEEIVKTYTPGKRWGSLFTWDSGMHALGMLVYSKEKALEIVNQYLGFNEVDAVVHGTPLPLHIYVVNEYYSKTKDVKYLKMVFSRLLKYYSYFSGLSKESDYDKFKSGLLTPHSDGYNTIGIDDYPVQHAEGELGNYGDTSNVSCSVHVISTGKMMIHFAKEIKEFEIARKIENHIEYLNNALLKYSYDDKSGYFSHVLNSTKEKLMYDNNTNYNMGIDGVSPILTGMLDKSIEEELLRHIMTLGELMTTYGITAVSQKAPYSRYDGYWNGKVWIPHQWFIWKALISLGYLDEAYHIAKTALETYRNSTNETYNSYEQFDVITGMGEGCHQFAGLTAPLAAFYNAYYGDNTITTGYYVYIESVKRTTKEIEIVLNASFDSLKTGLIARVEENRYYRYNIGGIKKTLYSNNGILELTFEMKKGNSIIRIEKIS